LFKLVAKLIDNNINLLNVNKFYIVKTKKCLAKVKNRKSTIIQAKKTKIKSIRRNFFDFKYINVAIKVSRDSKDVVEKKKIATKLNKESKKS